MLPLLDIRNLSVGFHTSDGEVKAVNGIHLTVNRGEVVAVVGESGSGKSVTSLSILQLLPSPPALYQSGSIDFSTDGLSSVDLLKISGRDLQKLRGFKIAMIFQEPMTSLNPVMSCGKQVLEAIVQHLQLPAKEAKARVLDWFRKVKLPDPEQLYHKYPHQLSGGQKQRVMIALAMCCDPLLLICDEPTTALDVTVQKAILDLIKELQQERQMGVLFITHDLGVVAQIADRVAIMYKGELLEQGATATVFNHPQHAYTKALIACRPSQHSKHERLPVVADFLQSAPSSSIEIRPRLVEAADHREALLVVRDLTVAFPIKRNWLGNPLSFMKAVDNVSFDILKGETLGLVGESGCGKSTLGRALLKLVSPTSGTILYEGKDLTKLSTSDLRPFRKEVQLVFQDPYSSLNPRLTIESALTEVLEVNQRGRSRKERQETVSGLLEKVQLSRNMLKRYPHEFSGGQRQRIVIARALAMEPHFLVCDESVAALDVSVQAQVLNLLNDLKSELGLTILFISHDLSVVHYMCDRIMVMHAGSIVERGPADTVYYHPKEAYTQKLIAAIPSF